MNPKASLDFKVILVAVLIFFVFAAVFYWFNQPETSLAGSAIEIPPETKEQVQTALQQGTEKLILSARNLKLNPGQNQDLVLGVYNSLSEELVYSLVVKVLQKEETAADFSKDLQFSYHPGPFFLESSQAGMNLVKIKAKEPGKYLVQILILNQDSEEYAKNNLLVEVKE